MLASPPAPYALPTPSQIARCALGIALFCALPAQVQAQSAPSVQPAEPGQIRVDGALSEWRGATFARLGAAADGSAEVALAHDAHGLYVGARVRDDAFVRSARPGAREDALVASLAFPLRDAFAACELWLFAGEQGRSAAQVQMRAARGAPLRRLVEGVRIVEGPSPSGYALEAFVPWNLCAGGSAWPFARGELHLQDADPGTAPRVIGARAAPVQQPAALAWLQFQGGASQTIARFLRERNLEHARPALELVADVRGDARVERVIVVGTFAVVADVDGRVDFADLPIRSASELEHASAIDLTGDARPELTLRVKQTDELGARELVRVLGLAGSAPVPLFGVETRRSTRDGYVSARLEFERDKRSPVRLVIRGAEARGLSPETYRELPAPDILPVALPWGAWLERTYAWDGQRFAMVSERPNAKARSRAGPPARAAAAPPPRAAEPTEPPVDLAAQPDTAAAMDAYKRARGIGPDTVGRFAQQANVAGDAQLEALAVYGRELVVTGRGLGSDVGYFFLGLPVHDAADVLGLQSADVTGDGLREALVRVRQRIGDVQRELLFCYALGARAGSAAHGAQQLLAVEVSRARGAQRIDNAWSLVPDKQRVVLTIEPGTARGWSAKDYPFVSDSHGGIAPILLPWKDRTTRYVFQRDQLVRDPRTSD
jgi:hypothetical protein